MGQLGGRPIGVMPPYSIPVSRTASSIPGKGDLAYVEPFSDDSVDVGSIGRAYQACGHDRQLSTPAGHHDAVRRDVQGHLVRCTELGSVGFAWVNGRDEAFHPKLDDRLIDGSSQELGMV